MSKDRGTMTPYPDLTKQQRTWIGAGIDAYARHLKTLAEAAEKVAKTSDATAYKDEAESIKEEIHSKLDQEVPQFRSHECKAIETGLKLLVKQIRAAKGTVRAIGKDKLAEELEEEAIEIEANLVGEFGEQTALKVD